MDETAAPPPVNTDTALDGLITFAIQYFTELETQTLSSQITDFGYVVGIFLTIAVSSYIMARFRYRQILRTDSERKAEIRKQADIIKTLTKEKERLDKVAETAAKQKIKLSNQDETIKALTKDNKDLSKESENSPAKFLDKIAKEAKEDNEEIRQRLAQEYVEHHSEALSAAYDILVHKATGQAVTDQAAGYDTALMYCRAAIALDPQNIERRAFARELEHAIAAAAQGMKVIPRDAEKRVEQIEQWVSLPDNMAVIEDAITSARDGGRYLLMLDLARHGHRQAIRLAGEGGEFAVFFTVWMIDAEQLLGLTTKAKARLDAVEPLLLALGHRAPKVTEHAKFVQIDVLMGLDMDSEALDLADQLWHECKSRHGEEHSNTMAAKYRLVQCLQYTDKLDSALEMAKSLLKLEEKILHQGHPHISALWNQISSIYERRGDIDNALFYCQRALSSDTIFFSETHPNLLRSKMKNANLLIRQGKWARAQEIMRGVSDVLRSNGLSPKHGRLKFSIELDTKIAAHFANNTDVAEQTDTESIKPTVIPPLDEDWGAQLMPSAPGITVPLSQGEEEGNKPS